VAAPRAGHVFLNFPFSTSYESLFIAFVGGLVAPGLSPRCVLEIPPQEQRLKRLFDLIRNSAYSIHDLSYVKLSTGRGPRVPRFNMPFELGLAVAVALAQAGEQQHQFRIFEAQPYRLQKSLSDVLGHDPYIHQGKADGVLEGLLNVFSTLPESPELSDLRELHKHLVRFRAEKLGADIFQPKPFAQIVVAARSLVAVHA
jgi:hypothetical protein